MRVIFMGTPEFSVPILEALHAHHDVVAVYTQPPSVSGRGQKQRLSAVHAKSVELDLPVFTPKTLRANEVQAEFSNHKADVAVVAAYGLILPQQVLDAPRFGCLNVHASLLPRWRGAAPIHRAVMAGDTESGVTIMQMETGLDTGPMLLKDTTVIDDATTTGELHDVLSEMGACLIDEALRDLTNGRLVPEVQPQDGITYATKIDKTEAALSFARPAQMVVRHIHGLSPYPGAFVELDGQRIKILRAQVLPDQEVSGVSAGEIIDDQFTIACDSGALRPMLVQRAGRGPADVQAFLRGFKLHPGTTVG